ncbi:protein abrupt [Drosophila madeirensis]|uniref:Protein abrupt n=1 Tax=Drosophila madeirensis TaxID=30013 RepID=A0AAU9FIV9_DROMD
MTESTQLQTAENNNAGVVKMEPPPPATSSTSGHALSALSMAATGSALSPATPPPSALGLSQHQHQHQSHQSHQSHHQQQQHYALKWNDFQTSILSSFRHLRDEEDFVDVTLACDERSFTAHKVVLSACSPYFRKLLKANPCEHPIVILRDVRSDDVENLLSFMYNGEVNVSHEQLPDFLKTAHLLQIRGLADVNGGYPYAKALSAALSHSSNSSSSHNNNLSSSHNNNLSESSKINSYLPQTQTQTMLNNSNISSGSGSNSGVLNSSHGSPFSTPQAPASVPASSAAAAAAAAAAASLTAAVAAAAAATASANASSSSSSRDQLQGQSTGSGSGTPAIQELKASAASPASSSNHWDMGELEGSRKSHLTPPPQKRIKSADLFRAQHGISPERLLLDREFPVAGQHPLTRNRAGRDTSKDRERNLELRESLLGQALENSNGQQAANQKHDLGQSAGEDSNSSDTEPSDRGDGQHDGTLDGIDNQRSHSFPNAFLGLQGIPGLLPGPSGMGSDFGTFLNAKNSIKQEAIEPEAETEEEPQPQPHEAHAADRRPAASKLAKIMQRPQLSQLFEQRRSHQPHQQQHHHSTHHHHHHNPHQHHNNNHNNNNNNNSNTNHNKRKRNRSANSSPTPSARSWNDSEEEHEPEENNQNNHTNNDDEDDRSSSASSAISLTMKRTRQSSESTLYQTLLLKQEQQQQQQQQLQHSRHEAAQQQQQQQQHQQQQQQQQQYLDELQQSVSVSHQQQLTANLFMARTIALSRSRDFPELFQNTSAAAVAAAAAAAASATAATVSPGNGSGPGPGPGPVPGPGPGPGTGPVPGSSTPSSSSSSNYMLPCPLCETPLEQRVFRQHLDRHYPRDSPVCPVIECGRRFAHPNSVRNHMRIKHTLQWAKMKAMRSSGGPFAGGPDFK